MVYFLSSPTVLVLHPGSCFILFSLSQPHGSYVSFFDPVCSLQITFITINISAIIQSKVFPTVFLDPLMRYYDLHLAVCVCVCVYVHVMSLHRNICPVFCSSAKCLPFLELCRISNLKSLEITYFFMCLGLYWVIQSVCESERWTSVVFLPTNSCSLCLLLSVQTLCSFSLKPTRSMRVICQVKYCSFRRLFSPQTCFTQAVTFMQHP